VAVLQADVADATAVAGLFEQLRQRWDGVDIVVNNAAAVHDGYVMLMPVDAWDRVVAVSLRGTFLCSRQALRPMIRRKWGRIVNVISPAALLGKDGAANYAAAKGGVLSFTKSLAREVGRYGITVNAVCPGLVDTQMIAHLPRSQKEQFKEEIALGRFGEPAEVAQAVRFLASPAAAYVTGSTLSVDGGLTMA
jgi:3-oxoacyl-[acyl-carrier protein] reductase